VGVSSAAQQSHQRNEVGQGKNKWAVGFRRIVCEHTDDAIEPLNHAHDERQSRNPLT
jgi:hypothetical protein